MSAPMLFDIDANSRIATVTLNRPDALNALSPTMLEELEAFWSRARDDDDINVVIVRGSTESKAFTSGIDVRAGDGGGRRRNPNPFVNRGIQEQMSPRRQQMWKPVICAVHGVCAGAGLFLVNDSDIAICADDAQFFDPHMALGIASAMGPIGMLWRVNPGEVMRYTLLSNAERLGAETALRIGLVTEITPRERLWARAEEIASIIAAYEPIAVQGTVKAIWEAMDSGRSAALQRASLYSSTANAASGASGPRPVAKRPHVVR